MIFEINNNKKKMDFFFCLIFSFFCCFYFFEVRKKIRENTQTMSLYNSSKITIVKKSDFICVEHKLVWNGFGCRRQSSSSPSSSAPIHRTSCTTSCRCILYALSERNDEDEDENDDDYTNFVTRHRRTKMNVKSTRQRVSEVALYTILLYIRWIFILPTSFDFIMKKKNYIYSTKWFFRNHQMCGTEATLPQKRNGFLRFFFFWCAHATRFWFFARIFSIPSAPT